MFKTLSVSVLRCPKTREYDVSPCTCPLDREWNRWPAWTSHTNLPSLLFLAFSSLSRISYDFLSFTQHPYFQKVTECYMCVPKETPKTFAVCTVRQHPSRPVHTLTWGRMLYRLLFGPPGGAANFLDDGDGMGDLRCFIVLSYIHYTYILLLLLFFYFFCFLSFSPFLLFFLFLSSFPPPPPQQPINFSDQLGRGFHQKQTHHKPILVPPNFIAFSRMKRKILSSTMLVKY